MLDRSLVDRACNADVDAFEEIVRLRMDAVFRLSYAILGDEADARDATQDTFVSAWRQLSRVREPERFDAWLQRVAVNAARMVSRSRRRRRLREIPSSLLEEQTDPAPGPDPAAADGWQLDRAIRSLSVEQRSILVLHTLEGLPIAELADALQVPVGTVKSRMHTARAALQAALDREIAR